MAELILPDTAHANDPEHIEDHNKIVTAISTVNTAVEAVETELGDVPARFDTVESKVSELGYLLHSSVGSPTYADEFTGTSLDSGWARVDATGDAGHLTWSLNNGSLVARHNTSADNPGGRFHALVRPVGTAFAVGDALVMGYTLNALWTNYTMVGPGLSNGTTHGVSSDVMAQHYTEGLNPIFRMNANTGMNGDNGSSGGISILPNYPRYARLVMTAANTWRHDYSLDGVNWVGSTATMAYTLTPTHMGIFIGNWTTAKAAALYVHCFRRYSGVT